MRLLLGVMGILVLAPFHGVNAQALPLDSLLRVNSYPMSMESEVLTGEGFEFIMDAARSAQFLAIAEEHNVGELNELTSVLFKALHQRDGFNYLALEQGTVIFRSLRPYAHQNRISDLSDTWRLLLFRADAALIIRGGKTGDYRIVKGEGLQ